MLGSYVAHVNIVQTLFIITVPLEYPNARAFCSNQHVLQNYKQTYIINTKALKNKTFKFKL